jgi:hypothetical protein
VLNELETQLLMYDTTMEFLGHPWSFVRYIYVAAISDVDTFSAHGAREVRARGIS